MNVTRRFLFGSAAALLALSFRGLTTALAARVVTISEANNGQTVALDRGDSLEVRLPSNPTTGYEWTALLSGSAVRQAKPAAYVRATTQLLGAGGTQVFSYAAVAAGTEHLTFSYARSWEHVPPLKRISLTVVVRAS